MKVLIAGATGMFGQVLAPALAAAGHDVLAHGNTRQGDIRADLTDISSNHELLDRLHPEAIVNLVALTDVDRCEAEPNQAYRLNVLPAEFMVDWVKRNRPCRLIQISTDQVYDGPGPHQESQVTIRNTYALSKYAAELAARQVDGTVLRTNFFGQSPLSDRPSFSDWLAAKLASKERFMGFDDVLFSPLTMTTLAEMVGHVMARPLPGVFNLGSNQGMSKADFAVELAGRLGLDHSHMKRASVSDAKLRAARPRDMRMDCRRFESAFGIKLPTLRAEIDLMRERHASAQH